MRLLLDTHVYLWVLANNRSLTAAARRQIDRAESVHVSAATVWEITIKAALGKLRADLDDVVADIVDQGFVELPIAARHALALRELPRHHGNPFDRMLVAQAASEGMRLMTADRMLERYGDRILRI